MKFLVGIFMMFSVSAMNCNYFFESENLCANFQWTTGPVLNEYSSFKVSFFDENDSDEKISPRNEVSMRTWMVMANGHSHGGPTIHVSEKQPGVFTVNDAKFFMHGMKGYWLVKISIKKDGDVIEEKEVEVEF